MIIPIFDIFPASPFMPTSTTFLLSKIILAIKKVIPWFSSSLAHNKGHFNAEIIPTEVKVKKKAVTLDADEHPRDGITLEQLQKLPAVFKKNGTVSPGNASVSVFLCKSF